MSEPESLLTVTVQGPAAGFLSGVHLGCRKSADVTDPLAPSGAFPPGVARPHSLEARERVGDLGIPRLPLSGLLSGAYLTVYKKNNFGSKPLELHCPSTAFIQFYINTVFSSLVVQ